MTKACCYLIELSHYSFLCEKKISNVSRKALLAIIAKYGILFANEVACIVHYWRCL